MAHEFQKFGIRFTYPDNWALEEHDLEDGQGVSVSSPGGAFWSVAIYPPATPVASLAQVVMQGIRSTYENSDVEPAAETIAGQKLQGYDVNFYCLDLTNTAQVRGFEAADATYVMLWQAEDREFEQVESVFRAIATTLIQSALQGLEDA